MFCSFNYMNEYLPIDSGGYLCTNSQHINCSMAEFFLEKLIWCPSEQGVKSVAL